MANDEFDNRRTDDEIMAALLARGETDHPGASIDIRTAPDRCEIFMNRPAVVDLIKKLQTVLDLSLPNVRVCVLLVDTLIEGKPITMLSIETDDASSKH